MPGFINKIGVSLALALALLMVPLSVAAAGDYGAGATREAAGLPSSVAGAGTVTEVVGSLVKAALSLIGIVFFGLIFYAGFEWMTAQGNSEKVERAKSTITAAALGLIIVLAAYAITNFVFTNLAPSGGGGTSSGTSPNPDQACIDNKNGSCVDVSSCISPKRFVSNYCPGAKVCCY